MFSLIFCQLMPLNVFATNNTSKENLVASVTEVDISIDGNFEDWNDKPMSYEYNWDNSQNCWKWGVWIDGVCYKTEEGTYDTNVRHGMTLLTDGEYLYLHIIFSRDYEVGMNGDDFMFFFDGIESKTRLMLNGQPLSLAYDTIEPGVYDLDAIHHDNSDISREPISGAAGKLLVKEDKINTELEVKYPLSEFKRQNPEIDLDNIGIIEFFTPNLMYNRLYAGGSNTGAIICISACLCVVVGTLIINAKHNKKKEDDVNA